MRKQTLVAPGVQVELSTCVVVAAMNYSRREVLVLVAIAGLAGYLVGASGQSRQDQAAESAGESIVLRV